MVLHYKKFLYRIGGGGGNGWGPGAVAPKALALIRHWQQHAKLWPMKSRHHLLLSHARPHDQRNWIGQFLT